MSINSIESGVTRLLVSTKHLLESLTLWAQLEADDKYVSDSYVKLGNDFRAATRAFSHGGIDVSDIGDVPQALRVILESALSETPSQENLDRFLPNIRTIIVELLLSLKEKQAVARERGRERSERGGERGSERGERGRESGRESGRERGRRSREGRESSSPKKDIVVDKPRRSRVARTLKDLGPMDRDLGPMDRDLGSGSLGPMDLGLASGSGPKDLGPGPYGSDSGPQDLGPQGSGPSTTPSGALSQLQNESFLLRRASKRFSAYQYAKLAHRSPPSFSTPDPNEAKRITLTLTVKDPLPLANDGEESDSNNDDSHLGATADATTIHNDPTIFLRIGSHTRKSPVKLPVTFASLRLLFVERFAYSPGTATFPDIYINDPKSGVAYELEDHLLLDVKPGCLLSLDVKSASDDNYSALRDELSHIKSQFGSLESLISSSIGDAVSKIEFPAPVSVSSLAPATTTKDITTLDPEPAPTSKDSTILAPAPATKDTLTPAPTPSPAIHKDIDSLQTELKVVRQIQTTNSETIQSFMKTLTSKVLQLQQSGVDGGKSSNRIHMDKCHTKLSQESDSLLTKVDDLQDLMEALRKDVAQRGVKVSDQQLKHTQKEITDAHSSLTHMVDYINNGKPIWKKIWEAELDKVCEEQQFFNLQDDLTKDLQEDISKIQETYALIEQCSLEQSKLSSQRRNKVVANLHIPEPGENLSDIKDAVLNQVITLRPDHESRVEAINRAERLREREREMLRNDEFQEELGNFIDDSKLKKSGGISEVERNRQLKDSENLKSSLGVI